MSLKISVIRNHNFSSGLVTRAALNAGATPTMSLTGSVDTAEIADASITNAKVSATAAISLSKLGDLDAGNILTGGGDYPVATSLLSSTNFSNPHHSISSNPGSTFKATLLLGNDTTAVTAVMSGDAELKADGALIIDPTFVSGKSGVLYRGRIDDLYADLGKKRRQARTRDLRAALDAVLSGRAVKNPTTTAVGCYIPEL